VSLGRAVCTCSCLLSSVSVTLSLDIATKDTLLLSFVLVSRLTCWTSPSLHGEMNLLQRILCTKACELIPRTSSKCHVCCVCFVKQHAGTFSGYTASTKRMWQLSTGAPYDLGANCLNLALLAFWRFRRRMVE